MVQIISNLAEVHENRRPTAFQSSELLIDENDCLDAFNLLFRLVISSNLAADLHSLVDILLCNLASPD